MRMLFRGGRVFDGSAMLDGHAVLVEGATIARIAPAGEFEGFDGRVVDTTGKTLVPGLIDAHAHLMLTAGPDQLGPLLSTPKTTLTLMTLKHAQATLMGGITSVRDVGGMDFIEIAVRDAIERGDFVGPTIKASGHLICMTGGHAFKIGRQADGVAEIVKAVREQVRGGADLIKLMATGGVSSEGSDPRASQFTLEEITAACQEAKRLGKPSAAHAHGGAGILNAVRGGITSIEHGIFLDEECMKEMLAHDVYLVPTFSVTHWTMKNKDRGTIPAHILEKTEKTLGERKKGFKMFYEAGGKIAMGTDAGTQYNHHGRNAYEMALMVDAGMKPIDALKATTMAAADLMRLKDRGRIADGFKADLVLCDGDPSADIEAAALAERHTMVMKDGRVVKG